MSREARNQFSPWIETLILGHGSRKEGSGRERLKAYVTGEGQVTQSQVQNFEGPMGLLLLTDGALQIPAVLTASAWEYLQEHEDRESYCSLLHSTVHIQRYQLQFHRAQQNPGASRFFLVVEALTTAAGGPLLQDPPCCSTLPSVRQKISETCRALRGPEVEDTEGSQDAFNLTDLLEQWHLMCVQEVLQDVMEKVEAAGRRPPTPQASTSAAEAPPGATGWDLDRVRFKGEESLSVDVHFLLIPEGGATQFQALAAPVDRGAEAPPPSDPGRDQALPTPADPEEVVELVMDEDVGPLSNPWDQFPPPCDLDSLMPPDSAHSPVTDTPRSQPVAVATSTQLPVHGAEESQRTTGHSYFPPYQEPPCWSRLPQSAAAAPGSSSLTPSDPGALPRSRTQPTPPTDGTNRKRKRGESVAASGQEAQENQELPSWLLDSQSGSEEGGTPGQKEAMTWREAPTVHADGRPFSYSYRVSGQNLEDLSRLKLTQSLLRWAVRYLLPPPHDPSVTSDLSQATPL